MACVGGVGGRPGRLAGVVGVDERALRAESARALRRPGVLAALEAVLPAVHASCGAYRDADALWARLRRSLPAPCAVLEEAGSFRSGAVGWRTAELMPAVLEVALLDRPDLEVYRSTMPSREGIAYFRSAWFRQTTERKKKGAQTERSARFRSHARILAKKIPHC